MKIEKEYANVLELIDDTSDEELVKLGEEHLNSIWKAFTYELLEFMRIRSKAFRNAENLGEYFNEEERNMSRREVRLKEAIAKAA
jgi:hypothetical protein